MTTVARPHPAQVPTLTEVIELLSPAPVGEQGMQAPDVAAPLAGTPAAAPIVTSGLPSANKGPSWTPMSTVVLPDLDAGRVPVLDAVVLDEPVPVSDPEVLAAFTASFPSSSVAAAVPSAPSPAPVVAKAPPRVQPAAPAAEVLAPEVAEISESQLAQRVLGDVQRQIDGMLDFRLREAMGPLLTKHSEALVRDLREELGRTMRDVVARSVAQEMAKLRQR